MWIKPKITQQHTSVEDYTSANEHLLFIHFILLSHAELCYWFTVDADNLYCTCFCFIVDAKEVPDYYDIVHRPMDFSTIKHNLKACNVLLIVVKWITLYRFLFQFIACSNHRNHVGFICDLLSTLLWRWKTM